MFVNSHESDVTGQVIAVGGGPESVPACSPAAILQVPTQKHTNIADPNLVIFQTQDLLTISKYLHNRQQYSS